MDSKKEDEKESPGELDIRTRVSALEMALVNVMHAMDSMNRRIYCLERRDKNQ